VTTPQHFTEDAHFDAGSIHDIAVNEASGFALRRRHVERWRALQRRFADGRHARSAQAEFCWLLCRRWHGFGRRAATTHDIQCVMYKGPDKRYVGHEICMASNETTVSIQDVTNKANVKVLSHADYPTPVTRIRAGSQKTRSSGTIATTSSTRRAGSARPPKQLAR